MKRFVLKFYRRIEKKTFFNWDLLRILKNQCFLKYKVLSQRQLRKLEIWCYVILIAYYMRLIFEKNCQKIFAHWGVMALVWGYPVHCRKNIFFIKMFLLFYILRILQVYILFHITLGFTKRFMLKFYIEKEEKMFFNWDLLRILKNGCFLKYKVLSTDK